MLHTSCLHSKSVLYLTQAHLLCLRQVCAWFMWSSLLAAKHAWMTAWLPCHAPSCHLLHSCWPAVSRLHCCCDLGGSITCTMHLPSSANAVKPYSLLKVAMHAKFTVHALRLPQTYSITAPKTAHNWHVLAVLLQSGSGWCNLLPLWFWLLQQRAEEGYLNHAVPLLSVDH